MVPKRFDAVKTSERMLVGFSFCHCEATAFLLYLEIRCISLLNRIVLRHCRKKILVKFREDRFMPLHGSGK